MQKIDFRQGWPWIIGGTAGVIFILALIIFAIRGGGGDETAPESQRTIGPAIRRETLRAERTPAGFTPTSRPTPTLSGPSPTPPGPRVLDSYLLNRSTTAGYSQQYVVVVTTIDVLDDGTMRLNMFFRNNSDSDVKGRAWRRDEVYIIDENGKRYEPIRGSPGWLGHDQEATTYHPQERSDGWILFPALTGGAQSFYLQLGGYDRIEGIVLRHEEPSVAPGTYPIEASTTPKYDESYLLTLESIDVRSDGTMRFNISFTNRANYDLRFNSAHGATLRDENGREYFVILGMGSPFDRQSLLHPKEKVNGWILFPVLAGGAKSFAFTYPGYQTVSGISLR